MLRYRRVTSLSRFRTRFRLLMMVCVVLLSSCANAGEAKAPVRMLLVGNSVIYTNNLPAIFERIVDSQTNAPAYHVDMFASGGTALSDLARDQRLLGLLSSGIYEVVVFQERGGDDLCVLGHEERVQADCAALIQSHLQLT